VSCLSRINDTAHLDTALRLIERHGSAGNVFINLTGGNGLFLYSSLSSRFKDSFVHAFKRNPKTVLGLTKTHLIIHSVKVLDEYGLVPLILPIIGLGLTLTLLPEYLVWAVFLGSSWYLVSLFSKKSKAANPKEKGGETHA
jgi:hypothetical protein